MLRVMRCEMRRAKLDHFARADEEHVLPGDRGVNALSELDRGGRHRYRARTDFGFAANRLRDRERALKKLVEHEPQRPRSFRAAHGLLELPEYLWLSEHHRIETARDTKCVLDRLRFRKAIQIRLQVLGTHAVIVGKPRDGIARLVGAAVDLRAVARRDDRSFLDALLTDEIAQGLDQAFGVENHPLAHVE